MLYFFSTLITNPIFYILFFLILGFVIKAKKWKNIMYGMVILCVLLFTNEYLYDTVSRKWYVEYDKVLPSGKIYEYGIVLGGYSFWDWERNRPEFSSIGDRLFEGVQLHAKGVIRKIVLASDGSLYSVKGTEDEGNPEGMKAYLMNMGIPEDDIILETRANNTHENATLTLELIGEKLKYKSSLLITSAIHMRRSMLAFNQVGLTPDAYMTDIPTETEKQEYSMIPTLGVIYEWKVLLHEMLGYIVYKMKYE